MNADCATLGRRLIVAAKVVQVRLRFVVILLAAFAVVGQWGTLRNHWDRLLHRLAGNAPAAHTVSGDTEYFCPMDPGVISDWPSICPVCNMDLVRRRKEEAVALPDGVVARMQFSPYRVQLAGIGTSLVEPRRLTREITLSGRLARDTSPSADPGAVILDAAAYDDDLPWLTAGRTARLLVEGAGGDPLAAVIEVDHRHASPGGNRIRLRIEDPTRQLTPGSFATATVSIPVGETGLLAPGTETSGGVLAVPESAVIDTGRRKVVYVEAMPGMFDGVEVALGARCGDWFPVLRGLEAGQRVATTGAFLIDAEARLNPSLAAGYFGANRSASTPARTSTAAKPRRKTEQAKAGTKLSAADRELVARQKTCPVTDLPLDSMGGPIPVDVAGQRVFICCKGCESRLKNDPQKYLAKLKPAE